MPLRRIRSFAFTLSLAVVFGGGASQAFARAAANPEPFPYCAQWWCEAWCRHYGAEWGDCVYGVVPKEDMCYCAYN